MFTCCNYCAALLGWSRRSRALVHTILQSTHSLKHARSARVLLYSLFPQWTSTSIYVYLKPESASNTRYWFLAPATPEWNFVRYVLLGHHETDGTQTKPQHASRNWDCIRGGASIFLQGGGAPTTNEFLRGGRQAGNLCVVFWLCLPSFYFPLIS